MPRKRKAGPRLYTDLAWTWSIVSPPEDYVGEAESALDLLKARARIPVKSLLHLGSGGGHLDWTFKGRLDVTGVDLSPAMLRLARRLNPEVRYRRGDMRTVRLRERFDAAAAFDSINHMHTLDDLRATFANAFAHLRPGGAFVTYAEVTRERFDPGRIQVTKRAREGTEVTLVETSADAKPGETTYDSFLVFFVRRRGSLEVAVDRHVCGIFPRADWMRLLREVGFQASEEHPPADPGGPEDTPWFVGVRPG